MSDDADKPESAEGAAEPESEGDGCQEGSFVIPGPPLPGGARMCLHHGEDHEVRSGIMKPLEHGVPIDEDAVLLKRREGTGVYDVVGSVADMKKGPSKVNSPAFKAGWDRIFGKAPTVGSA